MCGFERCGKFSTVTFSSQCFFDFPTENPELAHMLHRGCLHRFLAAMQHELFSNFAMQLSFAASRRSRTGRSFSELSVSPPNDFTGAYSNPATLLMRALTSWPGRLG
jgi:hypothetical protein